MTKDDPVAHVNISTEEDPMSDDATFTDSFKIVPADPPMTLLALWWDDDDPAVEPRITRHAVSAWRIFDFGTTSLVEPVVADVVHDDDWNDCLIELPDGGYRDVAFDEIVWSSLASRDCARNASTSSSTQSRSRQGGPMPLMNEPTTARPR
jgi:hypothetical protein